MAPDDTNSKLPTHTTCGAFTCATTYPFSSVSLDSLLITFVNTLQQACFMLQHHEVAQGDIICSIFACILTSLVMLFNCYTFMHIALYSNTYIPAAKEIWAVVKDCGVNVLITDCLLRPILSMGAVGIAYICARLSYLYLTCTSPEYNASTGGGSFTAVVMVFVFVIGLQVYHVFLMPMRSGVEMVFVGMAWELEVLMSRHPRVWGKIVRSWPKV